MRPSNFFTLRGRTTRDIELRTSDKGTPYCYITLAVEGAYRKDADRVTDFVPLMAYRGTAEFAANHVPKGTMIAVSGEIRAKREQDGDGNWSDRITFITEQIEFAGPKQQSSDNESAGASSKANTASMSASNDMDEDGLPF